MTCLMAMAIVVDFSFLISSAVQKCIACEVVTMNGISFTYIMSTSRITAPCHSIISVGSSCIVVITHAVLLCAILPCSDPIFVPKMSSARKMSALVIGKLGIMLCSLFIIKSLVLGQQACTASEYSLTIYLDLLLATVLINVCATSFLTSDKNSQFLEGLNDWVVPSDLYTRKPSFRVLSYVTQCFYFTLLRDKILAIPSG